MNNLTFREHLIAQCVGAMLSNTKNAEMMSTMAKKLEKDPADLVAAFAIGQADAVLRVLKIVDAPPSNESSSPTPV